MASSNCITPAWNWANGDGVLDATLPGPMKTTLTLPAFEASPLAKPASPNGVLLPTVPNPHQMRAHELPTNSVLLLSDVLTPGNSESSKPSGLPCIQSYGIYKSAPPLLPSLHISSEPPSSDREHIKLPPINESTIRTRNPQSTRQQPISLPSLLHGRTTIDSVAKKWDGCTSHRTNHQWDIKDIKLPRPTVFDPYELWPTGHCRRVYMQSCERARRHQSGWAMRNTNNHNPQVLKKSCLGVLECSAGCMVQGKPLSLRPAICDKARKKQTDRPCINPGCPGRLVLRNCRGHSGYPVTHFWRFANGAVYFEAKGEHDHNRPSLKTFGLSESYATIEYPSLRGSSKRTGGPILMNSTIAGEELNGQQPGPNKLGDVIHAIGEHSLGQEKREDLGVTSMHPLDGKLFGTKCTLEDRRQRRSKRTRRSKTPLMPSSEQPAETPGLPASANVGTSCKAPNECVPDSLTAQWFPSLYSNPDQTQLACTSDYALYTSGSYAMCSRPEPVDAAYLALYGTESSSFEPVGACSPPTQNQYCSRWSSSTSSLSGTSMNTLALPMNANNFTSLPYVDPVYPLFDPSTVQIGSSECDSTTQGSMSEAGRPEQVGPISHELWVAQPPRYWADEQAAWFAPPSHAPYATEMLWSTTNRADNHPMSEDTTISYGPDTTSIDNSEIDRYNAWYAFHADNHSFEGNTHWRSVDPSASSLSRDPEHWPHAEELSASNAAMTPTVVGNQFDKDQTNSNVSNPLATPEIECDSEPMIVQGLPDA